MLLIVGRKEALGASPKNIDSLRVALNSTTADSTRARLLCQLSFAYLPINTDSALGLGQQARRLAHRTWQPYWKAKALGLLAAAYQEQGELSLAVNYQRQETDLWQAMHHTDKHPRALRQAAGLDTGCLLLNSAEAYDNVKQYEKAQQAALTISDKMMLLLAALAGTWLLIRQRRLRAERDNAELRAYQAELQTQQLQAQEELRQSQYALELKNSELASLVLQVSGKEQLVADVKEELRAVAQKTNGVAQQRLQKMYQSLTLNAQSGANRDYMQQILEQVHPRFFAALQQRCPSVTQSDRRLAALLRLHFTTKDIAGILNISEDGVRKARYRLRRKLGLAAEQELSAFLYTLDEEATPNETSMPE
ncbi:hypothetical protein IC235_04675 [Hymenobacter sp. BT664]|uniref:HTH luxR-type domain-containing protein n=1 Tax=Hymenobacter montanus TaxID=2771359 RepID=A0A927GI81_9BACT|nr:hypothetical protein [Hymenobacter montanus]MBD2767183.1 hypothetical protein [Hymenobacter montanus]